CRAWQAEPHSFYGSGHRVCRIHTAAGTRPRTACTFYSLKFCVVDISIVPLTDTFEYRNKVDILAIMTAWCNRPAVYKNCRNISIRYSNRTAGHIFIAPADSYERIEVLTWTHRFYGICNNVP